MLNRIALVLVTLAFASCCCPCESSSECAIVHYDARLGAGSDECRIVFDDNGIDTCGPYAAQHCVLLWPGDFVDVADLHEVQTWSAQLEADGDCPLACTP